MKENANSMIFFMLQDKPVLKTFGANSEEMGARGMQSTWFLNLPHVNVILEELTEWEPFHE